ncbi:Anaphase promoting complex (APC) subunit 2 [Thermus arciformis]|uniref:Anaphase promoting complex (APC) subunit 2 n=1 Tax=Thermus arciformis TaxID=482827 RepID=A0A1G7CW54_9DEIN|nr:hypothetical protein [Thermus arciformis]SDE43481.1 Anaphase promoting complex (APC) subunit 2 [Thermus arciformis]
MDRKGWVMRALEALRFATFQEIQRYLDEEGEPFSKKELQDTLKALAQEGKVEEKEGTYRLARKRGGGEAFAKLFED